MANDMENATQVIDMTEVAEAPQVKTKKELKKERKAIKKHKKQVKKEARLHSAKTTKAYNFLVTVISIAVIVSMIFCSISAIKFTKSMSEVAQGTSQDAPAQNNDSTPSDTPSNTPSNDAPVADSNNTDAPTDDSDNTDAPANDAPAADATDVSTKEGAVALYKKAHAKVLAEAKSVTRTLDNNTQYNNYLEVGGNSTLAGVASTLMGMFLKANEEPVVHEGSAIAENFPPTKNSADGLTADMIGESNVKEEGDFYIVTLKLNSSEEKPDLGDNAAHLVSIVEAKTVEDAAAGFVSFSGLRNEYIAPMIEAKINKTTGQMTDLHTITPSYMKFDSAKVAMIINVNNVGIGLQYETKWTVQW